jgi:hypothetical protein
LQKLSEKNKIILNFTEIVQF